MNFSYKRLRALKLRKSGKSYKEIADLLNIKKSTLSYWFKGLTWSESIKKQLDKKARKDHKKRILYLNELRRVKLNKKYKEAEEEAVKEFKKLKNDPLFISGIVIYWGEGNKSIKGALRVSNTDFNMLRIFKRFLEEICKVESVKIKAHITNYPDNNADNCLKFWATNVRIPQENFYKITTIQGRHKTRRLEYGICAVSYFNTCLKTKVLKWIELLSKTL